MNVHPSAGANPQGPTTAVALRPRRCTSLRLTPMAMLSPISRTGSASRLPGTGRRSRLFAALRAHRPPRRATRADYRRGGTGLDGAGGTGDGGRRLPLLCRLAQRSLLFDVLGALNKLQFTGEDFFTDKDVCSIVLEVPNSALGPKRWACGRAH